jgi:hypothetical protein
MNCKITDKNGRTHGGCQWGEGVRNSATGEGNELCSDGVIHYYSDPLLAVFANPIHGNYDPETMILWEFTPDAEVNGDALKKGCKSGVTVKQIPIPEITTEQRVEIAIRAAKVVYKEQVWNEWADNWLSGADRSEDAARATRAAAWAVEAAAGAAAEAAAGDAAWATARAARAAAGAARAAWDTNIDILAIIKQVVGK